MYSAIREADGRFSFVLHVPPERLTPGRAREAVEALASLLEELDGRGGRDHAARERREWHLRRATLLAEAGRVLLEGAEARTAVQALAQLVCEDLADGCLVYLRRDGGTVEVARRLRSETRSHLEDLERWYLGRGAGPGGWIHRVLATGEPQVLADETQSPEGMARWPDESPRNDGGVLPPPPRRAIVAPIGEPGRLPLGALVLLSVEDGPGYGREELELAAELGARCAARLRWVGSRGRPRGRDPARGRRQEGASAETGAFPFMLFR